MNKRKISFLLSFMLVLSLVFTSFGEIVFAEDTTKEIRIVHLNDIHARVERNEREGAIGFAILKEEIDRLKKENPNTLVLSAGDTFHGTTMVNITEGEAMTKFMNMVGFDAMTPGNHDFNYGYDRLLELKDMCNFPIITGNVYEKSSGETRFEPYIIRELDGVRVGIFGLTTEETAYKTHPDNVKDVNFKNPIEEARKSVKALEDEGVDLIVGLTHMGNEGTTETTTRDLIKAVDGIDLVVDGHSHESVNEKINNTLLVQAKSYTSQIGVVDIQVRGGKMVGRKASTIKYYETGSKGDKEILDEIEKLKKENEKVLGVVVGRTELPLEGERADARTREINTGNLIADIMRDTCSGDIAITNGGGIRASKPAGDITKGDIIDIFPFTNTIVAVEATGEEIYKALEHSVRLYPQENGGFLQVSGISYKFDPKKEQGNRVFDIRVGDEELDLKKSYKLVTSDIITAGGDGYEMFKGKPFVEEGGLLSDELIKYMEKNKTIAPKVEGRIVIGDKPEEDQVEEPTEKPDNKPTQPNKDEISLVLNGETVELDKSIGEIYNDVNRIMVPVRSFYEALGHEVKWDEALRTVNIDGIVSFRLGDDYITVNGTRVQMDRKVVVKDGRSYVPIRFISEALGYEIDYDVKNKIILLNNLVDKAA